MAKLSPVFGGAEGKFVSFIYFIMGFVLLYAWLKARGVVAIVSFYGFDFVRFFLVAFLRALGSLGGLGGFFGFCR